MALQDQREIDGVNASKYEIELQTVRDQVSVEHKAREQVSADLKALVRFEQLEKQRLEEELTQEKAEGQAQRIALRLQLRELQSALDQVGTEEISAREMMIGWKINYIDCLMKLRWMVFMHNRHSRYCD